MNKRKILLLFIGGILTAGLFTGCMETTQTKSNTGTNNARFKTEYTQENDEAGHLIIIRDTKTGHAYLVRHSGYTGGICELDETPSK